MIASNSLASRIKKFKCSRAGNRRPQATDDLFLVVYDGVIMGVGLAPAFWFCSATGARPVVPGPGQHKKTPPV